MAPSHAEVLDLFTLLSQQDTQKDFFERVADDVDWWIVGSTPMSGSYDSKQAFQKATFAVLNGKVLDGPLLLRVVNVMVGGGEGGENWAVAELAAIDAKCRNGMIYNMRYCWSVRFGEGDGKIVQVRAYIDTDLLTRAIEQNP